MLIDTHCHLHDREFFSAEQAEEVLKKARARGVEKIICIGTDPEDSLAARDFAASHPDTYWTYGVHPENAHLLEGRIDSFSTRSFAPVVTGLSRSNGSPLVGLRPFASQGASANGLKEVYSCPPSPTTIDSPTPPPPIAIGEVGLDYHYPGYDRGKQIRLFEEMLQLAKDQNLPVSLHVREAFEDFFPILANFPEIRGVVHSFSDNKKHLRRILTETELYVGVNGLATYSTLPTPPLERILLETDAPFLTPAPFRGIMNDSSYIPEIAEWLGRKLGIEFKTIEKETTKNAKELFRF